MKKKRKDPNVYPPGFNAKRVKQIIAYYDAKQDQDLLDDPDHELLPPPTSWIEVPQKLMPRVRELIRRYRRSA